MYNYAHGRMTIQPDGPSSRSSEMNGFAKKRPKSPPPEAFGI
jgi:hypothetical protein